MLNKGYEIEDIVKKVRLPPSLASHQYLQEYYGMVSRAVRGVVHGKIGWFDRNPVNLFPISYQEKSEQLCGILDKKFEKSMNGVEKMLAVAKECMKS